MTHESYHERDESLYAAYDVPVRIAKIDERRGRFLDFNSQVSIQAVRSQRLPSTLSGYTKNAV